MSKADPKRADRDVISEAIAASDRAVAAALADGAGTLGKITPCDGVQMICGAKTRSGGRCKSPRVSGRKRCRMHGGTSEGPRKGSRHALKHGIYSDVLMPEDEQLMNVLELGSLDHELKIARIRLRRALREQTERETENTAAQFELDEVTVKTSAGVTHTEVKRTRRDYSREIRSLIRLVAELEVKRLHLFAGASGDPGEIAARIRAALNQIDAANSTGRDE